MSTSEKSAAPRRVRTGTVVWGAVILVVAALILVSLLTGIRFDLGIVFLGLLIGAGLALVLGGISSLTRRQSAADPGTDDGGYGDGMFDNPYSSKPVDPYGSSKPDDDPYDGKPDDGRYDPDRDDTRPTGS